MPKPHPECLEQGDSEGARAGLGSELCPKAPIPNVGQPCSGEQQVENSTKGLIPAPGMSSQTFLPAWINTNSVEEQLWVFLESWVNFWQKINRITWDSKGLDQFFHGKFGKSFVFIILNIKRKPSKHYSDHLFSQVCVLEQGARKLREIISQPSFPRLPEPTRNRKKKKSSLGTIVLQEFFHSIFG